MKPEGASFVSVDLPDWVVNFLDDHKVRPLHLSSARRLRKRELGPVFIDMCLDVAAATRLISVLAPDEPIADKAPIEEVVQRVAIAVSSPEHSIYPTYNSDDEITMRIPESSLRWAFSNGTDGS